MRKEPRVLGPGAAVFGGLFLLGLALSACTGTDAESKPTAPAPPTATAEPSTLPLDRFHYAVTVTVRGAGPNGERADVVVATEGDYQSPDRHAFTHTIAFETFTQRRAAVVIGPRAWLFADDGRWHAVDRAAEVVQGLIGASYSTARPHFLDTPLLDEVQQATSRLTPSEEETNGVPAGHYRVGPEGEQYFRRFLADDPLLGGRIETDWQLWLADDGQWPVRLLLSAQVPLGPALAQLGIAGPGTVELRIDISRPDDPALRVDPPPDA